MADDDLDGIFVAVIGDILLNVMLIRVKSFGVIFNPIFPI